MVTTVVRLHGGVPSRPLSARPAPLRGRPDSGHVARPPVVHRRRSGERTADRRRVGWGLIAGSAALVPWMWVLATTMPSTTTVSNWSAAWVGLDAVEAAALLGTGVLLLRRDPRYGLGAAVASTLLVVDAWFDVMTATSGPARTSAIMLAAVLELPLAALCAALAARSFTQRGAVIDVPVNDDRQSMEGRWKGVRQMGETRRAGPLE